MGDRPKMLFNRAVRGLRRERGRLTGADDRISQRSVLHSWGKRGERVFRVFRVAACAKTRVSGGRNPHFIRELLGFGRALAGGTENGHFYLTEILDDCFARNKSSIFTSSPH